MHHVDDAAHDLSHRPDPRLAMVRGSGVCGSIACHSSSVRSLWYRTALLPCRSRVTGLHMANPVRCKQPSGMTSIPTAQALSKRPQGDARPAPSPCRRLRERRQLRRTPEGPSRPHARRIRLHGPDRRARKVQARTGPSISGTEYCRQSRCQERALAPVGSNSGSI